MTAKLTLLKSAPPVPAPTQKPCWFFSHEWGPWTDRKHGQLIDRWSSRPMGEYVVQEKRCARCNKLKLRTVKTTA